MNKVTVRVTKEWNEICASFANQSVGTHLTEYAARGQSNRDKIVQDIIYGKCAELAVWQLLTNVGFTLEQPDFKIYHGRRKSFDADLSIKTKEGISNIHVKSCGTKSAKWNGISWNFTTYDPLVKGKYDINNEIDFVVGCVSSPEYGNENKVHHVEVHLLCRWHDVFSLLGYPKKESLRHSKRTLYLDDVKESGTALFSPPIISS